MNKADKEWAEEFISWFLPSPRAPRRISIKELRCRMKYNADKVAEFYIRVNKGEHLTLRELHELRSHHTRFCKDMERIEKRSRKKKL